MKIEVLVCKPDGSQFIEERNVAEDWFSKETAAAAEQSPETGQTETAE